MPDFEITAPDGGRYQVTAPDEQSALSALKAQLGNAAPKPAAAPAEPPSTPVEINDVVRAGARGVPIVGGLLNKANAATNAALAPLVEPFLTPGPDTLDQPTFGERYDKSLAIQNKGDQRFEKEHPIINTAAEVAGGIGALAPLGATALGARLLGSGAPGAGVASRVLEGAGGGAAINAVDAAIRGNEIAPAAAVGGIVGGAVPAVSRGLEAVVAPVGRAVGNTIRAIRDPAAEAERRVGLALQADQRLGQAGLSQAEMQAAQAAGQPAAVIDAGGEVTRALARSAANTSPEGRAVLSGAIDDRFESQAPRFGQWLRQQFHYPDAVGQQEALQQAGRTANRAAYDRAYQAGDAGLWSPELEQLTSSKTVAAAMRKAADEAGDDAIVAGYGGFNPRVTVTPDGRVVFNKAPNGMPTYPDLRYWDLVRRNISDAATEARGKRPNEHRMLSGLSDRLNSALDDLVPDYAAARATASAFFGAGDALEAGANFVTQKFGNREAINAVARMTPVERRLFQDGFVSRLMDQVQHSPDRRSILNSIANSDAYRDKLRIALGPTRAREIEAYLHIESIMDHGRRAVQGNSTTMRQMVELGLAGGTYGIGTGGNVFNPDMNALMNAALVYGAARGKGRVDNRVARQVGELLASPDPARLRAAMQIVSRHPQISQSLRAIDTALSRSASEQMQTEPPRVTVNPRPGSAVPYPQLPAAVGQ